MMNTKLNKFLMALAGVAAIVDALKNYILDLPFNQMGCLLMLVVYLFFSEIIQNHLVQKAKLPTDN